MFIFTITCKPRLCDYFNAHCPGKGQIYLPQAFLKKINHSFFNIVSCRFLRKNAYEKTVKKNLLNFYIVFFSRLNPEAEKLVKIPREKEWWEFCV